MSGPRYVEIPADRLMGRLREIGEKIKGAGGAFEESVAGREVVVDFWPPAGRAHVRVFTSMAVGAEAARGRGKDAVRVLVGASVDGRWRPLSDSEKILRTAPMGATDRVGVFLDRLVSRLQDLYRDARARPACPLCGRVMVRRSARAGGGVFWGCAGFPECRGTRPIPVAA